MSPHYWAILVAALWQFVVGGLWYSPVLFGKQWMKLMGWSQEDMAKNKKSAGKAMGLSFIATLVLTYILALFIQYANTVNSLVHDSTFGTIRLGYSGGLELALLIWLGFVATIGLNMVLFEKKPFNLYLIHMGYQLVGILGAGAILGMWR